MSKSKNVNKIQKIKYLSYPVEVKLETRGKQGVYNGVLDLPKVEIENYVKISTNRLLEVILSKYAYGDEKSN